jgi:uncharacterized membrane protein YecN with MAPEG domain
LSFAFQPTAAFGRKASVMATSVTCTALLGLLLFGLGLYVSLQRQFRRVIVGHPDDPADPMHRAVRAHANTAEYAPFLALLFLWHGTHQPAGWVVIVIIVATASRFLLVAGLLWWPTMARPNPARFVGALLTYLCGLALAAPLLMP